MQKIQLTQNNWKIKFIFYGLATQELYFLKKNDRTGNFPRPRETDPYAHEDCVQYMSTYVSFTSNVLYL